MRKQLQKLKNRTLWFIITCITLIVVYGINAPLEKKWFVVDQITLALLVLCMIPVLQKYLTGIKGFGVELSIREQQRLNEMFKFLRNIAGRQKWTFYEPRQQQGEVLLGEGFKIIIDEIQKDEDQWHAELKKWLDSGSTNLKWFAAEIIGYYKIDALEGALKKSISDMNMNDEQDKGSLNCLWAYSRFHDYRPLIKELEGPKKPNVEWIREALNQMKVIETDPAIISSLKKAVLL
ncbi:MAG: hypothetical protein JNL72_12390 [Flavipsychrobacter sp.]|nr:hypothetical protein [Flavipsychrobacter sp.]